MKSLKVILLSLCLPSLIFLFLFLTKKASAQGPTLLCCPEGYGIGTMDCPLVPPVDKTKKCCKRTGFGQYDIVDKIPCDDPNATDKSRCEAQGGYWNQGERECIKQIPVNPDGSCNPGYEKIFLGPGGYVCRKVLFRSEDQKIYVNVDECEGSTPENPIINTALGCIPATAGGFINWVFKIGTLIGGGIAFLLMAWGTFLVITSAGNPDQLVRGKDIIISAVSGLLFIIFAVFLLRLIGVDILKIPGFK